jgi:hypothetical protein
MEISTLPDYPGRQPHAPPDVHTYGGHDSGRRGRRILRDLALLAGIVVPLVELRWLTWTIERPDLERDLDRVYALIPDRNDFNRLGGWCGLEMTPATPADVAAIREALNDPVVQRQAWAGGRLFEPHAPPHFQLNPKLVRWFRLHRSNEPGRWIGVGEFDTYNMGPDRRVIVYRVPIGFRPRPE